MKDILIEYGGAIIGIVGAIGLLWVLRVPLFSPDGLLAQLVRFWQTSAC